MSNKSFITAEKAIELLEKVTKLEEDKKLSFKEAYAIRKFVMYEAGIIIGQSGAPTFREGVMLE